MQAKPKHIRGGVMQIAFRGRQVPVTDALKQYAEKRLAKLERFIGEIKQVYVTFSIERDRHRVEVTIPLDGLILRGEEETPDMYSSVDLVVEKLERQVERYRTRFIKRAKGRAPELLSTAQEGELGSEDEMSQVARVKRFPMKPMSVEEAIMQMNLVGHNFFVFVNADTEQVNVVYRRRQGNYGLIEPEI